MNVDCSIGVVDDGDEGVWESVVDAVDDEYPVDVLG